MDVLTIAPELLAELHTKSSSFGRNFADQFVTSMYGKQLVEGGEDKVMAVFQDELRHKIEMMRETYRRRRWNGGAAMRRSLWRIG